MRQALVREGNSLLNEADELLIRAALEEAAAAIRAEIEEIEDGIARSEPEIAAAEAELSRLETELAECLRRAGTIQAAAADDDLTVRIEARALRLARSRKRAPLSIPEPRPLGLTHGLS